MVTHTAFAKVPDQRRTAPRPLALHRIRDTKCDYLSAYGLDPWVHLLRKTLLRRRWIAPGRNSSLPEFRITASRKSVNPTCGASPGLTQDSC